jgi:hypothetical protein
MFLMLLFCLLLLCHRGICFCFLNAIILQTKIRIFKCANLNLLVLRSASNFKRLLLGPPIPTEKEADTLFKRWSLAMHPDKGFCFLKSFGSVTDIKKKQQAGNKKSTKSW